MRHDASTLGRRHHGRTPKVVHAAVAAALAGYVLVGCDGTRPAAVDDARQPRGGSSDRAAAASLNAARAARAAEDAPRLVFPLRDMTEATAPVSAVFDHSQTSPYAEDGVVVAVTGATGRAIYGADADCYARADGGAFDLAPTLAYRGARSCGGVGRLAYDGHPGYDYAVVVGTQVYAPLRGTVTYREPAVGTTGHRTRRACAAAYRIDVDDPSEVADEVVARCYAALTIVAADGSGARVRLLHLSSFRDPETGVVYRREGGRDVPCRTCAQEGEFVDPSRPEPIAYTGQYDQGSWTGTAPHLHLEVVNADGVPVDPYGWAGPREMRDPYTRATNVPWWGDGHAPSAPSAAVGSVTVSPNPCTVTTVGGACRVTVAWTTANVGEARLDVVDADGARVTLATERAGELSLPWIQALPQRYRFELLDVTRGSAGVLLSAVTVAVPAPGTTPGAELATGRLTVSPNPCTVAIPGGSCTVTVTWTTTNVRSVRLSVVDALGATVTLATALSGSLSLPWIQALPQSYRFELRDVSDGGTGVLLDEVRVAVPAPASPPAAPAGSITATPNPCVVTTPGGTCTIILTWNSTRATATRLIVVDALGAAVTLSTALSGSLTLPWIQALPQSYRFSLWDYSSGSQGALLASVAVAVPAPTTRPTASISATPNPCTVTTPGGTCTLTLAWQASGVAEPRVVVVDANGASVTLSTAAGGSRVLDWIQALPQHYTFQVLDASAGLPGTVLASVRVAVPAPAPRAQVELTIDGGTSSTKTTGQTFTVGARGLTPGGGITRLLRDPGGNVITLTPALRAGGDGTLSWAFTPVATTPRGTSTLWVVDDATGRTSNVVTQVVR